MESGGKEGDHGIVTSYSAYVRSSKWFHWCVCA